MPVTDEQIRGVYASKKLEGRWGDVRDGDAEWVLGTFSIHKHRPACRIGWGFDYGAEAYLFRRWFEFEDLGVKGWAIIFHHDDPSGEIFVGWVPEDRRADADRWIDFINGVVYEALVRAGQTPTNAKPPVRASTAPDALRYVGDFIELGYTLTTNPQSLVNARGKRASAHKAEVLAYLRTAKPISMSPGINPDYFDPTKTVRGETLRTDGVYLWPDYLADYVERYDVELPDEFEQHMKERGWHLPENLDVRALKKPW